MINMLFDKDLDLVTGIDASNGTLDESHPTLDEKKSTMSKRSDIKARAKTMANLNSEIQALTGADKATSSHDQ